MMLDLALSLLVTAAPPTVATPTAATPTAATPPAAVAVPAPESGASDLERLSREVARAREDVEALAADVDTARQAARAELLSLEARERDVGAELDSVRLKTRALMDQLAQLRAAREAGQTDAARDDAVVRRALEEAERLLDASVPFDVDARRARLATARITLETTGAAAAAPLVWQHLVDERVLADSVALGKQPVQFVRDGKPVRMLADTLHVGLVLLFFKTRGGTVGWAQRDGASHGDSDGNGWRFQLASDADARVRILALFDAARHGPPQGTFLVPSPLGGQASPGGAR